MNQYIVGSQPFFRLGIFYWMPHALLYAAIDTTIIVFCVDTLHRLNLHTNEESTNLHVNTVTNNHWNWIVLSRPAASTKCRREFVKLPERIFERGGQKTGTGDWLTNWSETRKETDVPEKILCRSKGRWHYERETKQSEAGLGIGILGTSRKLGLTVLDHEEWEIKMPMLGIEQACDIVFRLHR